MRRVFCLASITTALVGLSCSSGTNDPRSVGDGPSKLAQRRAVSVTSQIVKAVRGKHRYFFDIRNNDTGVFEGSVTIDLLGRNGTLGRETFTTRQPIAPGLGTSVFFDINTGPVSVHGEYGITAFRYEVRQVGQIVASGGGSISERFEPYD